jgi:hypothetical protein
MSYSELFEENQCVVVDVNGCVGPKVGDEGEVTAQGLRRIYEKFVLNLSNLLQEPAIPVLECVCASDLPNEVLLNILSQTCFVVCMCRDKTLPAESSVSLEHPADFPLPSQHVASILEMKSNVIGPYTPRLKYFATESATKLEVLVEWAHPCCTHICCQIRLFVDLSNMLL